jgi:predicted amidohydrolase
MADETDPETGAPKEGYIVAKIDLDQVRKNREEFQFIQNRQPAIYRPLVRKY